MGIDDDDQQEPLVAAPLLRGLVGPDRPPAELFRPHDREPDGSLNIDGEHCWGYTALWDTCHTGHQDRCVLAPREDDYDDFLTGYVGTEGGDRQPVGVFTWGIPHADLTAPLIQAQAHYADSRHGFAHMAVGANRWGIWHSGALRPGITRDDVRDLRALSMSGDWRHRQGRGLKMIAALAVNYPGFPVPRRQAVTAGAGTVVSGPAYHLDADGELLALVAAGMVPPAGEDCGCGGSDAAVDALLSTLTPLAIERLATRLSPLRPPVETKPVRSVRLDRQPVL